MKMSQIVGQLRLELPSKTGLFSDDFNIDSFTVSGGVAIVSTSNPHNMRAGDAVSISGVVARTPISAVSKDDFEVTFTTSIDHDLTENFPSLETVTFDGFTDIEWNKAIPLKRVPNRRTFVVSTTLAEPVLNGSEVVLEPQRIDGVNGVSKILTAGDKVFNFATEAAEVEYDLSSARIGTLPRVMVCATAERALSVYDEFKGQKAFAFVVSEGGATSKDRSSLSDAVAARVSGDDLRMTVVNEFMVAVYIPVEKELAGETGVELCTGEILNAVVSSLFGLKLPSPFAQCDNDYKIVFTGHELLDYNSAVLIWGYNFQVPSDLTVDNAVEQFGSRAFRDLDYLQTVGNEQITVLNVDLDDEPLT